MDWLPAALVFVHVTANVVWIGSILAVAAILSATGSPPPGSARQPELDSQARGALAHRVYRTLSAPAFGISFLAGAFGLAIRFNYFFVQTKFMYGKLFFALLVIALHHVIGGRARRTAGGSSSTGSATSALGAALFGAAAAAVFLAIFKPF